MKKQQDDKLVPYSIEAEEAVLGSLLLEPFAVSLIGWLTPGDFYRETNRWVFEAVLALYARRDAIDFLTVRDELERRRRLDDVGGASFLASLINTVPTAVHIEHYARIVQRAAVRRRLIQSLSEIGGLAYDEERPVETLKDDAERILRAALSGAATERGYVTLDDYLSRFHEELAAPPTVTPSIMTGLADLDAQLGGLQPGDLTIVAGRPGRGKTSLLNTIGLNVAACGHRVAMNSLEMAGLRITRRAIQMHSGVSGHRLRLREDALRQDELDGITAASGRLSGLPFVVDEERGLTIATIRRKAREEHARAPFSLLLVDYLQLVRADKTLVNRNAELEDIVNILREVAGELACHVMVASQLSREGEKRGNENMTPGYLLTLLRDSGAIEQAADNVIFPNPQEPPQTTDAAALVKCVVAKQRDGATGAVDLGWWPARSMFINRADIRRINDMARGTYAA